MIRGHWTRIAGAAFVFFVPTSSLHLAAQLIHDEYANSAGWGRYFILSGFLLAVTFTWLMGLMGFARSGIRQHWHVYGVMQDRSPDAVTPALGYAANVITVTTILFFAMVMFW